MAVTSSETKINGLKPPRTIRRIYCLFSGGRDSALACYIAYQVAKVRGLDFKLVFINTGTALPDTPLYVRKYAEWLGVNLIELSAVIDYWEGVNDKITLHEFVKITLSRTRLDDFIENQKKKYQGKACQGSCML